MPSPDESEIGELRALMREHGLLPDLPASHRVDPADAERTLQRVIGAAEPRQRRSVRLLAAAAAVVLGAAAVWTVTAGSDPAAALPAPLTYSISDVSRLAKAPSAASVLRDLAKTAQGVAPSGVGDVQSVATSGWLLAVDADADEVEVAVTRTDSLLAADGSATITQNRGPALDVHGRLKPASTAMPGHGETSDSLPAGTFDAELAVTLPRDPHTLRAALLTLTAGMQCITPVEQTYCLIDQIQQLYAMYVVPGDLANGLWLMLASEPGVHDLGETTDRLGRPAHAIGTALPQGQAAERVQVLLVSPDSGRLTGTETVTLRDADVGISSPAVTEFQTWLDSRFTESTDN